MDGNFGLVRRSLSGIDAAPPRMEGGFFLPQADVDLYLAKYNDPAAGNEDRGVRHNFIIVITGNTCAFNTLYILLH